MDSMGSCGSRILNLEQNTCACLVLLQSVFGLLNGGNCIAVITNSLLRGLMLLFTDANGFSRTLVDSRDLCLQFSNAGLQCSFGCCCLAHATLQLVNLGNVFALFCIALRQLLLTKFLLRSIFTG